MSPDKGAKHRLNKGAYIVLEALEEIDKLCSAQEICTWLKANAPEDAPGLTTVYRAIDTLLTWSKQWILEMERNAMSA